MDVIAHALWANLVFKEMPHREAAIAFSMMPDLVSFVRATGSHFFRRIFSLKSPRPEFPKIVFRLYDITHSLLLWLVFYLVLKFLGFEFLSMAFCGWGLHILLDIFTHKGNYFPTPILWPLSRFHFSGIKWSDRWALLANYSLLAVFYVLVYTGFSA
jgi:membrane-bound metal-dependent hydrolase YbcI (DUF457 family)